MFGWLKKRNRLDIEFKIDWENLLLEHVDFYDRLSVKDKEKFKLGLVDFLNEVKITGISCEVEDLDKLLIASSALIPVFAFPKWKYLGLNEILLHPKPFNTKFNKNLPNNVTGMVGNGYMNGKMILSKTSLRLDFQAEKDKKNVGIHEFVHLVDGMDGEIDGLPKVLMEKQYVIPWMDMLYRKIKEIQKGKNKINPYGATNEQEFFAVVSEYFFEHPSQLQKKHPKLYEMLKYFYSAKV